MSVLPGVSGDLRPRGESLSPPAGLDQWWNDPSYISGPQEHLEGEVPFTGTEHYTVTPYPTFSTCRVKKQAYDDDDYYYDVRQAIK